MQGAATPTASRAWFARPATYGIRDTTGRRSRRAARSEPSSSACARAFQRASARRQVLPHISSSPAIRCAGALQSIDGARSAKATISGPFASAGAVGARSIRCNAHFFSELHGTVSSKHARAPVCFTRSSVVRAVHETRSAMRTTRTGQRSQGLSLREEPGGEGDHCSRHGRGFGKPGFRACALYRDRLAALSHVQSQPGHQSGRRRGSGHQFAIHHEGAFLHPGVLLPDGQTGQSRLFSESRPFDSPRRGASAFSCPVLRRQALSGQGPCSAPRWRTGNCLHGAQREIRVQVSILVPQRAREEGSRRACARKTPREAHGRKLAETASPGAPARRFCRQPSTPLRARRIEIYDNSHIHGAPMRWRHGGRRPGGLRQRPVPKVQHQIADITPGDDFGMMAAS